MGWSRGVTRLVTQDLHTYCDHAHAHAVQSISGRNQAAQQLKRMQSGSTAVEADAIREHWVWPRETSAHQREARLLTQVNKGAVAGVSEATCTNEYLHILVTYQVLHHRAVARLVFHLQLKEAGSRDMFSNMFYKCHIYLSICALE